MRALDAWELEFQMVVSSHVGTRTSTWVSLGEQLSRLSSLTFCILSHCLFMASCFFALADLLKSGSILLNFRKTPLGSVGFLCTCASSIVIQSMFFNSIFLLTLPWYFKENIIHNYKGAIWVWVLRTRAIEEGICFIPSLMLAVRQMRGFRFQSVTFEL